jgi:hypothetical protein
MSDGIRATLSALSGTSELFSALYAGTCVATPIPARGRASLIPLAAALTHASDQSPLTP